MVESEGRGEPGERVKSVWWKLVVFNAPWIFVAVGEMLFGIPVEIWLIIALAPVFPALIAAVLDAASNIFGKLMALFSISYLMLIWGLAFVFFGPRNAESWESGLMKAGLGVALFVAGMVALNYSIWTIRPLIDR